MKKIFLLISFIFLYTSSFSQNGNLKLKKNKNKYERVFFKSPNKYNNKEQSLIVTKINYLTNYNSFESKNKYQISIYGWVNNNKIQIVYNAKSIEELTYYKKVFKGKYKKILLFEHYYSKGGKNYNNTSISVEY